VGIEPILGVASETKTGRIESAELFTAPLGLAVLAVLAGLDVWMSRSARYTAMVAYIHGLRPW